MPNGFSGITEISETRVSEKVFEDTSKRRSAKFISNNPDFWDNLFAKIERCKNIFLYCLKEVEKQNTEPKFVFFHSVITTLLIDYADEHNIQYGDGVSTPNDVDHMWREDTIFLFSLLKEMVMQHLSPELPVGYKVWLGTAVSDMFVMNTFMYSISELQKKEKYSADSLFEISYACLLKTPSGKYTPNIKDGSSEIVQIFRAVLPPDTPYTIDGSSDDLYSKFQSFFKTHEKCMSSIEEHARAISELSGCEREKIVAMLKVFCFRRFDDRFDDEQISEYISTIIHKEFPLFIMAFCKAYDELFNFAQTVKKLSVQAQNDNSGCFGLFLLLPFCGIVEFIKRLSVNFN